MRPHLAFPLIGGGAWSPLAIRSAVLAWFDASLAGTITQSSGAVSSWASRVGSITADQATGAAKPAYSATARNSLPGLSFSGAQKLALSSVSGFPTGDNPGFICVVGYTSAGGYSYAFSYGDTTDPLAHSRSAAVGSPSNPVSLVVGGVTDDVSSSAVWLNNDRIFVGQYGSGQLSLTADGELAPITNNVPLSTSTAGGALIGAYAPNGGSYWTGVVQEVLVGNRKLTTSERQKMEGYLAWKWGLQSHLPTGHPYKSVRP